MDWKVCRRKRSWPNLRYYPGIYSFLITVNRFEASPRLRNRLEACVLCRRRTELVCVCVRVYVRCHSIEAVTTELAYSVDIVEHYMLTLSPSLPAVRENRGQNTSGKFCETCGLLQFKVSGLYTSLM
jgi:hypothetical protein